jgi:hypothetical protein
MDVSRENGVQVSSLHFRNDRRWLDSHLDLQVWATITLSHALAWHKPQIAVLAGQGSGLVQDLLGTPLSAGFALAHRYYGLLLGG